MYLLVQLILLSTCCVPGVMLWVADSIESHHTAHSLQACCAGASFPLFNRVGVFSMLTLMPCTLQCWEKTLNFDGQQIKFQLIFHYKKGSKEGLIEHLGVFIRFRVFGQQGTTHQASSRENSHLHTTILQITVLKTESSSTSFHGVFTS